MADSRLANFSSCCRLCLAEKPDSIRSIFDEAIDDRALAQKISASVSVEITPDDKLSTMVCAPCLEKINNCYSFKQTCTDNQTKLEQWLQLSNADSELGNIQIKEEPIDQEQEPLPLEVVLNGGVPIKAEPLEVEYNELPPPLTPQGDDVEMVEHSPASQIDEDGYNPRKCPVCDKLFSSSGNRKKHERIIHGINPMGTTSESEMGSLSQDDRSQSSMDSQPAPEIILDSREPNSEEEKILFAAGLKLLQCNSTPPISLESLSKIEHSYIEKCKAMCSMYTSLVCACHNVQHPNLKGLLSHLRSLRIWFPVFTCYHCMVTLTDRSTSTRHHLRCSKTGLETLVKLSNLKKRSEVKTRLYQNYKCTKCRFMYSFHEDFCTHVDEEHSQIDMPTRCTCGRVFSTIEDYKDHAYVSCLVQFYCDICFVTVKTLDAFQKHAVEVHDQSEGFVLLQDDNYKQRRAMSLPSTTATTTPTLTTAVKREHSEENIVTGKRRSTFYKLRVTEVEDNVEAKPPSGGEKVQGTVCPICSKEYSNNNNMWRHYQTHHRKEEGNGNEGDYDDSLYCCPDCGGMFSTAEWEKHKEQHKKKLCNECGKVFQFQSELDQHRSVHLNLKVFRDSKTQAYRSTMASPNNETNIVVMCEICDTMYTSKEQLREHKLTHETMPTLESETLDVKPKKFSCQICDKHYAGYGGLWDHNRKKHPENKSPFSKDFPKKCKYCEKVFYTGGSYFMHKQMHERTHQNLSSSQRKVIEDQAALQEEETNEDAESYHTCKRCFKVFANRYSLKNHMKCHGIMSPTTKTSLKNKGSKKVWCDICHSAFDSHSSLEQHKSEEHNEDDGMPNLSDEEIDVKTPFVFTCDVCVQTFTSKVALKKHKEKHAQERVVPPPNKRTLVYCKYCKISFENPEQLNKHMQEKHTESKLRPKPKEKVKQYACNICRKAFSSAAAMYAHQGWHKRGKVYDNPVTEPLVTIKQEPNAEVEIFKCVTCKAILPNDTALQIHILEKHRNVNTFILPARCNTCNLDFTSQDEYEQHKRYHNMVEITRKTFPCVHCPAAFSRIDTLNAHVRQFHKDQVKHEFKCAQCERIFDKQSSLSIHLKVHEKQRLSTVSKPPLFSCSICNLGFDLPKDLRAHTIQAHPF